ncbi:hypothetical protein SAMN02745216_02611 [Desulfatibacillum alkenivorans DSM 16219]|jgi:hypothetical protein|uniref:Uncharacterized protein n=1 Tax=Desulfatibacillum alkenivorans DSM 16219 TaxID=1121393 RepID=A0A1M6NJZ2_9BACT|nr:hypothetical protein SAMN02745216_02611 [Desulfatibacillum alkenivorans DSM 16219]
MEKLLKKMFSRSCLSIFCLVGSLGIFIIGFVFCFPLGKIIAHELTHKTVIVSKSYYIRYMFYVYLVTHCIGGLLFIKGVFLYDQLKSYSLRFSNFTYLIFNCAFIVLWFIFCLSTLEMLLGKSISISIEHLGILFTIMYIVGGADGPKYSKRGRKQ